MKIKELLMCLFLTSTIGGCSVQNSDFSSINEALDSVCSNEESNNSSETSKFEQVSSTTEYIKEYSQKSYSNPIYNQAEVADPSIIYCDDDNCYYIISTGGRILKSKNMVYWYPRGFAFDKYPSWGTPGAGLWAPDIQYIGGQYVMYYSLSTWGDFNPGIGVATAPHPEGPWEDNGKLFKSLEIGVNNSIDPMVFVDLDNKVYMIWGSMRGNYIVELTSDGLALKDGIGVANSNKIRVAGLDTSTPWNVDTYEGAYIIYENGYYYLFLSMGTCCEGLNSTYKVVVGHSKSIKGPYLDDKGVELTTPGSGKVVLDKGDYFVGSGHNSVIKDQNGEYFIYYHTFSLDYQQYRILAMDHMYFDENGWPCVKDSKASKGKQENGPTTFKYVEE